ncbi:MAG TPA: zinc-binding alcohol dehydrogenase family protein [Pseudolabrys sp.]|nr:zinc-binding alcohol dehydrogenase family protein [Pseudolabrys sp.]
MKAVGYTKSLPVNDPTCMIDVTVETPAPGPRDLRVAVKAVSVNPVDTKVRMRAQPKPGEAAKILGYDAAGVVEAIGAAVTLFKPGDEVFYAGSIARPGTNGELHLVDERIVGRKPRSLSFAQAAALPLTAITAWEMLFDRFGVVPGKTPDGRALLIIGGAGGVGSIMIQLARKLTALTVIATASRPETRDWCLKLGADHVIDHAKPLADQLKAVGHAQVALVAGVSGTDRSFPQLEPIIAPQGKFALIDDPKTLDISPFKRKAVSVHWESMFTRAIFETPDMIAQHKLLNEVSAMIDGGLIVTTAAQELSPINAANLIKAHAQIESGTTIGKVVLVGW